LILSSRFREKGTERRGMLLR